MSIKLLAIGSRIMGDDGVAIAVAEELYQELTLEGIQVIIGETDTEYSLSCINEGDSIIILDAAVSERPLGAIWQLPLNNTWYSFYQNQFQHDTDLLGILKMRNLQFAGLLICIEVKDIGQRWGLSEAMQNRMPAICSEIKNIIMKFRGDIKHA